jgi:hypothetical protein
VQKYYRFNLSWLSIFSSLLLALTAPSFSHAACGIFEVAKGDVKIEEVKSKAISSAATGSKICSGDTITAAADSRAKIKMEDGNELNVSPNSKIVIEKYDYRPDENKKKVLLNVLYGKIRSTTKTENMYNDKSKDGDTNSFRVRTKTAVAGVRGTDFVTGFDPVSNRSEIITFKGKVEFGSAGPNGIILNSVQIPAGMKSELSPGQSASEPKAIPKSDFDKANLDTKAAAPNRADKQPDLAANPNADGKSADGKRDPANAPPAGAPGGSMIDKGDLAGGAAANNPDFKPLNPVGPGLLPQLNGGLPPLPNCPQCTDAIQNGRANVNVKICNAGVACP